jgi:hypothetical protein
MSSVQLEEAERTFKRTRDELHALALVLDGTLLGGPSSYVATRQFRMPGLCGSAQIRVYALADWSIDTTTNWNHCTIVPLPRDAWAATVATVIAAGIYPGSPWKP